MRQRTKEVDWEHGQRLFQMGKSFGEIATDINVNKSSVCRRAQRYGWERAAEVLADVAGVAPTQVGLQPLGNNRCRSVAKRNASVTNDDGLNSEERRERVKERIRGDVERVLSALDAIDPQSLKVGQLLLREKVAETVMKRANAVFDMEKENKPIINIAVMAQLPNDVAIAATIDEG